MFRNYLVTALRNIFRNKLFSFVNIFGLAMGIVSCLLIYIYIIDEMSFDRHHKKADQIYRIQSFFRFDDVEDKFGISSFPAAPTLAREYPDISEATRLFIMGKQNVMVEGKTFNVEETYFADSNFFKVFDFHFIYGHPDKSLAEPNQVVITTKESKEIFGDTDPLGKIIQWNNKSLKVTGVIDADKYNTHIPLGAFISLQSMNPQFRKNLDNNWGNNNSFSYVVIKDQEVAKAFQPKLNAFVKKYVLPEFKKFGFEGTIDMYIEPLKDIHFNNYLIYDTPKKGNKAYVYIFSVVAILILCIACINYMNLSTAAATRRAKEIGIRKVAGAGKMQLIGQFIGESLVISLIAALLSIVMLELFIGFFNHLTDKNIHISQLFNGSFFLLLLAILFFIGVVAGSYPAFYLSRFSPQTIFKNHLSLKGGTGIMRKILVTGQFVIAIFMITGTFAVFSQISFMKNKELGFRKDNMMSVVVAPTQGDTLFYKKIETLKNELKQVPSIKNVAGSAHIPGEQVARFIFSVKGKNGMEDKPMATMITDADFPAMMGMKIVKGRNFDPNIPSDQVNAAIINETTAKFLGWTDPLKEMLVIPGDGQNPEQKIKIIGVIKDFHIASLQAPIEPLVIFMNNPKYAGGFLMIETDGKNIENTIKTVEEKWKKILPEKDFEYKFLDDKLAEQYLAEDKMFSVFSYFALLTIFISCLGLYGLASFTTQQRTKEIGIRKVLGASVRNIIMLINKEFIILILIAVVIACPLAWYAIDKWLNNFAYRIDINIWFFIASAGITLLLTIITVSSQALRTSIRNPVTSLRYE